MAYEQILSEVRGRVGIIRLNRPEKLNAYTQQMSAELQNQVGAWNRDKPATTALTAPKPIASAEPTASVEANPSVEATS